MEKQRTLKKKIIIIIIDLVVFVQWVRYGKPTGQENGYGRTENCKATKNRKPNFLKKKTPAMGIVTPQNFGNDEEKSAGISLYHRVRNRYY